jgi:hypothetical protein
MSLRALAGRALAGALLLWTVPSPAPGTTHRVQDPKTIQKVVNAAAYGDTVLVAPGTYPRVLVRPGIRLISEKGPEETKLRNDRLWVIHATDADTLNVVEGFTLDGGKACNSVVLVERSTLLIRNCAIRGGWAGVNGQFADVRAENCKIRDCQNGVYLNESKGVIIENDIRDCGTGIRLVSSSPQILRSTITHNSTGIAVTEYSDPAIGGTIATANSIFKNPGAGVHNTASIKRRGIRTLEPMTLHVPFNFWGSNCPDSSDFRGPVVWSPWVDESAKRSIERCAKIAKR